MLLRNVSNRVPVGTTDRSLARSAWERDKRETASAIKLLWWWKKEAGRGGYLSMTALELES
jgi:hypothetical protein